MSLSRIRGRSGLAVLAAVFLVVLVAPALTARADTFDDACAAPTLVENGGNATHNLSSGQVLFIDSGTYTGTINNFPAGAVICVDTDATFQPSALNGSVAGAIYVRGAAIFPGGGLAAGFLLDNYGAVSFPGGLNANGLVTLINRPGSTMSASTVNWQGTFDNAGVTTLGALNLNSGLVTNVCTITVTGSVIINSSGSSVSGQMVVGGDFTINSGTFDLDGILASNNFSNNGALVGSGSLRIEGSSTNNGTVTGDVADLINIYDVTQTNPPNLFDNQPGAVTNAERVPFTVDPAFLPAGCEPPPPAPEADLSVTKTGPTSSLVGEPVTYTIGVTNNGPDPAIDVMLQEDHDASFSVTAVTLNGQISGTSVQWDLGDIAPSSTVTAEVTGFYTLTGTFVDTVGASSGTVDPDPSDSGAELSTTVQNRPPDVEDLEVVTNAFTPVTGEIEWSDPDAGQTVTFAPDAIQIQELSPISPDGIFTYTPTGAFAGREIFLALGCDDGVPELCEEAEIEVVVFPVAEDDVVEVAVGSGVTIEIAANDSGGTDPPSIVMSPSGGTAVVDGSGFLYTPDPGFTGTDSFIYEICAPGEPDLCDQATVIIEVQQVVTTTIPGVTTTTIPGVTTTSPTGGTTTSDPGAGSSTTSVVGNLPFTGAQIAMLAAVGLSAIGLGSAMVVSTRGRRR